MPLTHDHHHALAQARRMLVAVGNREPDAQLAQAKEFLEFFSQETLQHFREEEEVLLPLWVEHVGDLPEPMQEILIEHVRIHAFVRKLSREVAAGVVNPESLRELGEALQSHIRKEENQVFPLIEKALSAQLQSFQLAPRDRGSS